MKTLEKVFIIIVLTLIMNTHIKAQESNIDFNGLITGKSYKVLITNGWETAGKLTKNDSNSIDIKTEHKTFTIQKKEIKQILNFSSYFEENDLSNPEDINSKDDIFKDKLYLSVGTGINFKTYNSDNEYASGINFQLNITKIISPHFAIRGDFQFGQIPRMNYSSNYSEYYNNKSEGGDINNYSLKFDFLLGALRPASKINGYAILGGGLNVVYETERNFTSSYQEYNYYTNEYTRQTYSYTSKGYSFGEMVLEFGGGIGYKVSDKFRIYSEAQYGFPIFFMGEGGIGFYPLSILYGNPTLKIGVQMGI